jgi:ribose-phosphate pyrophosphokinase
MDRLTALYDLSDSTGWEKSEGVEVLTFPGGEPHANFVHGYAEEGIFRIDLRGGSFAALGEALVVSDALRRDGAIWVELWCPYLPGARQDRGAPLTAKVYANVINAARFTKVTCVDPHSMVMPALLDHLSIIDIDDVFPAAMVSVPLQSARPVIICPDAGAAKRSEAIAGLYGLDVKYARKHRDPATGNLSGFSCEEIPDGATAIVVDDICDGGGTFVGLAQSLNRDKEFMRLWTTHGIYSKGLDELSKYYSMIGGTDSFPTPHKADVEVRLDTLSAWEFR